MPNQIHDQQTDMTPAERLADNKRILHEMVDNLTEDQAISFVIVPHDDGEGEMTAFGNAHGGPLLTTCLTMVVTLGFDLMRFNGQEGNDDVALYTGLQMLSDVAKGRSEELERQRQPKHVTESVEDTVKGKTH